MSTPRTVLQHVSAWPGTGPRDGSWVGSVDEMRALGKAGDAFVRSSVRVAEIYGRALRAERIPNRCSEVRLQPVAVNAGSYPTVIVVPGGLGVMELIRISCPHDLHLRGPAFRAQIILEAIDAGMQTLAASRGWSTAALSRVRAAVDAEPRRFIHATPVKASPSRQHRGRAVVEIYDDGFARIQLEMFDRAGALVSRSPERTAMFSGLLMLKQHVLRGLHWSDATTLHLPQALKPTPPSSSRPVVVPQSTSTEWFQKSLDLAIGGSGRESSRLSSRFGIPSPLPPLAPATELDLTLSLGDGIGPPLDGSNSAPEGADVETWPGRVTRCVELD